MQTAEITTIVVVVMSNSILAEKSYFPWIICSYSDHMRNRNPVQN